MGLADPAIKLVAEGLEIDIDAVEQRCHVPDGLRGHIAVADKKIFQALIPGRAKQAWANS
jgi:hypothetical protein